MRIALASTVSAPVRQDSYGSVEAWIWLLARELTQLGHEVVIFGCGGSGSDSAEVISTLPGPYGAPGSYDDWELCEWVNLCAAVKQASRFDVLHSQPYLWGIPLQPLCPVPMIHTLHIVPDTNAIRLWESAPQSYVNAISREQWSVAPHLVPSAVIHHAVDARLFNFSKTSRDYLLFLGRFSSGKGPIRAIEVARELDMPLVLAGPENPYFREKIKPLVDEKLIHYAGYADPVKRNDLLGGARALLYPIQYPESFGLVLVEAMLCGTPVAAMRLGAVPEIVAEGVGGFTAETKETLPTAVQRCLALDRANVRRYAEERFSAAKMAASYASLYRTVLASRPTRNGQ